jgi:hypothetical protein
VPQLVIADAHDDVIVLGSGHQSIGSNAHPADSLHLVAARCPPSIVLVDPTSNTIPNVLCVAPDHPALDRSHRPMKRMLRD